MTMNTIPPKPVNATRSQFNLVRRFAILGFVSTLIVGTAAGLFLSRYLVSNILTHEAEVMTELLNSFITPDAARQLFAENKPANSVENLNNFFENLLRIPGMIRANIYSRDHTLIWSSTRELSGEHFEENDELDEALQGEPIIGISVVGEHEKEEHVFTDFQGETFVEYYIPIKVSAEAGVQVAGIIEFYRLPTALLEKIKTGERIVWLGTLLGGVFLFVMLFGIIRRAARTMAEQEEQLIDSEKFAAIGKMASVVAHGLRNPLSAIRSSAELGIEINPSDDEVRECLGNVVDQADRLEKWIGEYLVYARLDSEMGGTSHVDKVIRTVLAGFQSDMDRQQIGSEVSIEAGLPRVCINELLLTQVLHSLVSNALEAMTSGGQLGIRAVREARQIVIKVTDNGCGMPEDLLAKVFKPFQTTKTNGLGVGLPLVEQVVKGHGGNIVITSKPHAGTQVTLWLPMEESGHEA